MLIGNTDFKVNSSFLAMEKDTSIIITKILEDTELKKLLYYTTKDCLSKPDLNQEQTYSLIGENVRIVPRVPVEKEGKPYVIIAFDNFMENQTNPEFRDSIITFDILMPFEMWDLDDFRLRPYKIAGRIDGRINNQRLTGIGKVQFLSANQMIINDQFAGITLMYQVIHGGEDTHE